MYARNVAVCALGNTVQWGRRLTSFSEISLHGHGVELQVNRRMAQWNGEGGRGQLSKPIIDGSPSRDRPHLRDSAKAEKCPTTAEARLPRYRARCVPMRTGEAKDDRRCEVRTTGSEAGGNENFFLGGQANDGERWSDGGDQKEDASVGHTLELGQFDEIPKIQALRRADLHGKEMRGTSIAIVSVL